MTLLIVAGFAVYDVRTRRAPDKALVFFCAVALAAPGIKATGLYGSGISLRLFASSLFDSLAGAALGFAVLLAVATLSKGGQGVGGGDIKLTAVLGFIYGPSNILGILFIASLLALLAGCIIEKLAVSQTLRLPFIPFIVMGCLTITALLIPRL